MLSRSVFVLLSVATAPAIFGATFTVTIKAVDGEKRAVAKADVALFWTVRDEVTVKRNAEAVTDETGKTVLRVDDWNEKRPVLVLSADRKLGGIVGASKADDGREVTVTLTPTVRVKGKLACTELGGKPAWANTIITSDGFRAGIAQSMGQSAEFEFMLPPGKYVLQSYGTDVQTLRQRFALAAGAPEYDLGTLDLKASAIAKLKGKPAPDWEITGARGVKPTAKLADYKGKWVYLEFWGFW
jgi:hypothetical protein